MRVESEKELVEYGREIGRGLKVPAVIELVGDVGAGKTTLTRGIAEGLGAEGAVTSPSFTICKRYGLPGGGVLAHYDFYRLGDPGLMREDVAESLSDPLGVTVVEWGGSVGDLLPEERVRITILVDEDGGREVVVRGAD